MPNTPTDPLEAQVSRMIIECYNHDNTIDIVEELQQERRQLEVELQLLNTDKEVI